MSSQGDMYMLLKYGNGKNFVGEEKAGPNMSHDNQHDEIPTKMWKQEKEEVVEQWSQNKRMKYAEAYQDYVDMWELSCKLVCTRKSLRTYKSTWTLDEGLFRHAEDSINLWQSALLDEYDTAMVD